MATGKRQFPESPEVKAKAAVKGSPKVQKRIVPRHRTITQTTPSAASEVSWSVTPSVTSPGPASGLLRITLTTANDGPVIHRMRRPAQFGQDTTLQFIIAEQIKLLSEGQSLDEYDCFGVIYDITATLRRAEAEQRLSLGDQAENLPSTRSVLRLRTLLDAFKNQHWNTLMHTLGTLNTNVPANVTTAEALQEWNFNGFELLRVSRDLAEEAQFLDQEWAAVSRHRRESYLRHIEVLHEQGIEVQFNDGNTPPQPPSRSILLIDIIDTQTFPDRLQLPELNSKSSGEDVLAVFNGILGFYERWSERDQVEAPSSFFVDLHTIQDKTRSLLAPDEDDMSLMAKHLNSNTIQNLENWSRIFTLLWANPAQQALNAATQQLATMVTSLINDQPEDVFTIIFDAMRTMAPGPPDGVTIEEFHRYCLPMAHNISALAAFTRLAHLHATYQEEFYFYDPYTKLWLLIWRSLKSIYSLLRANGFQFPAIDSSATLDQYLVDRVFFNDPEVLAEFEATLGGPEAAFPREIENLVGRYCVHVEACAQDVEHFPQLEAFESTEVSDSMEAQARDFHRAPAWNPNNHVLLQRITLGLNDLNGRASVIRRSDSNHPLIWVPASEGDLNLNLLAANTAADRPSSVLPQLISSEAEQLLRAGAAGPPNDERLPTQYVQSSFSWLHNPMPETRGNDVVASKQIERDMADPGILSEGPQILDLVTSTPPRQVIDRLRSPSASVWSPARLVTGIMRVLRGIDSGMRLIRSIRSGLQPGATRLTPEPRNVLGPIFDRASRVSRSSRASSRQSNSRRGWSPYIPPVLTGPRPTAVGSSAAGLAVSASPSQGLGYGGNFQIFEDGASPARVSSGQDTPPDFRPPRSGQGDRLPPFRDQSYELSSSPVIAPTIESVPQGGPCHRCPQFPGSIHHFCINPGPICLNPVPVVQETAGSGAAWSPTDPPSSSSNGTNDENRRLPPNFRTPLEEVQIDPQGYADRNACPTVSSLTPSPNNTPTPTQRLAGNTTAGNVTFGPGTVIPETQQTQSQTQQGPNIGPTQTQTGATQTQPQAAYPAPNQSQQPQQPNANTGSAVPMRADYMRMRLREMRDELDHRTIDRYGLGTTLAIHVDALQAADAAGNYGRGAYGGVNNARAAGIGGRAARSPMRG